MRGSCCIFNSMTALRRVFVNSAIGADTLGQPALQRVLLPTLAFSPPRRSLSTKRNYKAGNVESDLKKKYGPNRAALGAKAYGPKPVEEEAPKNDGGLPRDEQITAPFILVRDEETGKLTAPQRPWDVLGQFDPKEKSLVMVMDPSKMNGRSNLPYPVCRIVDRKAELEAQQAREADGIGKSKMKELELNWAIAPNDLERGLKQLRTFLEKGYFVEVRLMRKYKKGKKQASEEEAKVVLQRVEDLVKSMPEVRQTKGMEGVLGKQIRLSYQGKKLDREKKDLQEAAAAAAT
ncbi:hypothetical protein QBC34DRAFT_394575 [Podospora aff. communis PSN243]|uniref:Translation initiation factor IF-3 n=1 Tax=Podospora aff. communis PSN243 TaxID=3040156 RepID=A0AAV9GZF8_9PEZI|nr:hypothetical protein QBC34DRAFT_394575 [Podospora aff. communis PSN243]